VFRRPVVYAIGAVVGVAVAYIDLFADKGEMSPAGILLLLSIAGAIVTLLHSRFSVALCAWTSMWLPGVHIVLHALGRKSTLQPDTTVSILMVGIVGFCATLLGSLATAAARRHRSAR
jgi:hypothetical protein